MAAEHGAIGCIIYSDPHEDGYFRGDTYPKGGYRPESGAQRGSVADMPLYPGDPLTPDVGATADAQRLPLEQGADADQDPGAADLLRGRAAAAAASSAVRWRRPSGAARCRSPITSGPGPAKVHLQLAFDWGLKPIRDVIARPCRQRAARRVGAARQPPRRLGQRRHRPGQRSGGPARRGQGRSAQLAAAGWRPRRTIVYAAWDGEEPGLLGSTEWAEAHAEELPQKAVAYINTDSNSRGLLRRPAARTPWSRSSTRWPATSPTRRPAPAVADAPARPADGSTAAPRTRRALETEGRLRIDALGSGSDYTPFLQHLGIASLNLGFGGEGEYGQYHSIYDSIDHFERFMDPDFAYGVAMAKVGGRVILRLADADSLPFDPAAAATTYARYGDEIEDARGDDAQGDRGGGRPHRRRRATGSPPIRSIPGRRARAPPTGAVTSTWRRSRTRSPQLQPQHRRLRGGAGGGPGGAAACRRHQQALEPILYGSERALTREEGLPGRPWFRHFVYAPGFYTGYGVKTLPAVREAIEQREWDAVEPRVVATAEALRAFARQIDAATGAVQRASSRSASGKRQDAGGEPGSAATTVGPARRSLAPGSRSPQGSAPTHTVPPAAATRVRPMARRRSSGPGDRAAPPRPTRGAVASTAEQRLTSTVSPAASRRPHVSGVAAGVTSTCERSPSSAAATAAPRAVALQTPAPILPHQVLPQAGKETTAARKRPLSIQAAITA